MSDAKCPSKKGAIQDDIWPVRQKEPVCVIKLMIHHVQYPMHSAQYTVPPVSSHLSCQQYCSQCYRQMPSRQVRTLAWLMFVCLCCQDMLTAGPPLLVTSVDWLIVTNISRFRGFESLRFLNGPSKAASRERTRVLELGFDGHRSRN
jgi:hypothetical protein